MIERHTRKIHRVAQRIEQGAGARDERREVMFRDRTIFKSEAKTETAERFNARYLIQQFIRPVL
jgi:hypothetical protein